MNAVYGSTVVRNINPEPEWVDITPMGSPVPILIEKWRGWQIDLWGFWEWDECASPS
jgi:hypothetical protein